MINIEQKYWVSQKKYGVANYFKKGVTYNILRRNKYNLYQDVYEV